MDIVSAFQSVGTYRGAAAMCGTTPKTVRRVIARWRAGESLESSARPRDKKTDVVATLTVLVDPTAGDALGRLLTGARWRLGPRDLAALESRARALVRARRPARTDDGADSGAEAPGDSSEALAEADAPAPETAQD